MRDLEITTLTLEDETSSEVPEDWRLIHPDKEIQSITLVNFDATEEVIGFIKYTDGFIEVGVGESLRPYGRLYFGTSEDLAEMRFGRAIVLHAGMRI